ncbi:MAG: PCMD domain-containing protein [Bacteroidales bacterium]|nr:PCMD domain-containing protein [Bacteroidales bacterium]
MIKNILTKVAVVMAVIFAVSCNQQVQLDGGYGTITIGLGMDDSIYTRSDSGEPYELTDEETVTISVLQGTQTIVPPTTYIYSELKEASFNVPVGTYTVVATVGESHAAKFDSPFYSGSDEVDVYAEKDNLAEIICSLANVKVSVHFDENFPKYFTSYKVYVDNGSGEGLTFSSELGNLDKIGYFAVTGILNWELTLVNNDGEKWVTSDSYTGVKARQHYPLEFKLSEIEEDPNGSGAFRVTVDNSINVKDYELTLDMGQYGTPEAAPDGFELTNQISFPQGDLNTKSLTYTTEQGWASIIIKPEDNSVAVKSASLNVWYDLVGAEQDVIDDLASIGIKAPSVPYGSTEAVVVDFTEYIASLELGEYTMKVSAYDVKGGSEDTVLPITVMSNVEADMVSVVRWCNMLSLEGKWFATERPSGMGFEYAPAADTTSWTKVNAEDLVFNADIKRYTAVVKGLAANTEYLVRPYTDNEKYLRIMNATTSAPFSVSAVEEWAKFAVIRGVSDSVQDLQFKLSDGSSVWLVPAVSPSFSGGGFVADIRGLDANTGYTLVSAVSNGMEAKINMAFRTENAGIIYNLGFDDWHLDGKIYYPYASGMSIPGSVWDSANKATASLKGSSTVPDSHAIKGQAVKMESKYVVIAFAAGNIYTGRFNAIDGMGADLDWGTPFTSRPVALKGYYDYKGQTINRTKSPYDGMKGQPDKCQIQMFLTDWNGMFNVNTTDGRFVDMNADYIIASGKLESSLNTNGYIEFTIPLVYRDTDRTPTYAVISAASSYLGDYFTGGEGSVMYLDELSLVYDLDALTPSQAASVNYR